METRYQCPTCRECFYFLSHAIEHRAVTGHDATRTFTVPTYARRFIPATVQSPRATKGWTK